jgi:hypothetical protein
VLLSADLAWVCLVWEVNIVATDVVDGHVAEQTVTEALLLLELVLLLLLLPKSAVWLHHAA